MDIRKKFFIKRVKHWNREAVKSPALEYLSGGLGSTRLMAGLDDLSVFSSPNDSVTL